MIILAMDLGQSKSLSCEFDTVTGEYRFKTFDTSGPVARKLLAKTKADRVVIGICPLAAMVYDIGRELGVPVADPTQDACRWRNVKRKTDRDDARRPSGVPPAGCGVQTEGGVAPDLRVRRRRRT